MGEQDHWARRMPWRLMGFGAAFIAALFAWRHRQDSARALDEVRMGQVDGATAALAAPLGSPTVAERRSRPVSCEPGADELEIALEVQNEELTVEEETAILGGAAAAPRHVVLLVHERAPAEPEVIHERGQRPSTAYPIPHRPVKRVVGAPRPTGMIPRSASWPTRQPPQRRSSSSTRRAPTRSSSVRGGGRAMRHVTARAPVKRSPR